MDQRAAIETLLRDFATAYANRDRAAMRDLFANDDDVVFFGTQANLHFFGWAAVDGSLEKQFAVIERARIDFRDVPVRLLAGGGAACVAAFLDYEARISGAPVAVAGVRMTCALERSGDGYRIVQMHWSAARGEVLVEH